ncbi:hypothetical protein [Tenacibaculum finnmarkense]|uniref:Uncharacterized protein n=1 Tax=Tenacibaculum finnmarkense genomovar ulcerans TaxID=2781388 RepID=A0A2I2M977_9FLAO|nr:hypothetical protein [Tenacibaculum finnmarkense]MBE7696405.1 hypothetical protein [Tenacibaculum finnmarkense genomovar ulcerans]SOU89108.1 conserved hypothetical protein [Tenacibaculum finnmarkense genomovar ulcerans]
MENINIFEEKYSFAVTSEIVEYLPHLFYIEDHEDQSILKNRTLHILKKVLDLDILEVIEWIAKPELENKNLTTDEIIKHIDEIWFEGAEFPDFYAMVEFGSTKWYKSKLNELGLTHDITDWDLFVRNKIGDLEKWIKENRPK